MPNSFQLYMPEEALIHRVAPLRERYEQLSSQRYADVTYHLQIERAFDMGNVPDSEAGVTAISIEARLDDGGFIGRLIAYIFDMDKLGHLGLMDVFSHSERTQALFKQVYQGDYDDCADDYLFQPAFLEALKAQLKPEVIQEREDGGFGMDEYCMGYHIAFLDLLEVNDWTYRACGDEMVGVLKELGTGFDFLL